MGRRKAISVSIFFVLDDFIYDLIHLYEQTINVCSWSQFTKKKTVSNRIKWLASMWLSWNLNKRLIWTQIFVPHHAYNINNGDNSYHLLHSQFCAHYFTSFLQESLVIVQKTSPCHCQWCRQLNLLSLVASLTDMPTKDHSPHPCSKWLWI